MGESLYDRLAHLNARIGKAESEGDTRFFEDLLASAFAFRRANGVIADRAAFLGAVKKSPERDTQIDSITLFGSHRALVTCVVRMTVDGERRAFHNVRLFVSDESGDWKLLAWANEPG